MATRTRLARRAPSILSRQRRRYDAKQGAARSEGSGICQVGLKGRGGTTRAPLKRMLSAAKSNSVGKTFFILSLRVDQLPFCSDSLRFAACRAGGYIAPVLGYCPELCSINRASYAAC